MNDSIIQKVICVVNGIVYIHGFLYCFSLYVTLKLQLQQQHITFVCDL